MNVKKKWAGYTACICGLLYAFPHFWWGLGVSFGFPGDFAKVPDEILTRVIGYWFMGLVAVVGALFGLSFVYKWGEKLPRRLKLILAWFGCIGLSIWGFSFFEVSICDRTCRVRSFFRRTGCEPDGGMGICMVCTVPNLGHRAWFCCLFRSVLIVRIFPPLCMGDIMTKKYPNIIIVIYILYRH